MKYPTDSCVSPELAVNSPSLSTPELLGTWVRVVVPVSTPRCWADAAFSTQEGWQGAAFEYKLCSLEEINVGLMASSCVEL